MPCVIGLDVGGTSMKAALVSQTGQTLAVTRRPTPRHRGPDTVAKEILNFASDLAIQARGRTAAPPSAAGVAVPGLVDEASGVAVRSANIGWRDVPLRELLATRLGPGVPVAVGHDVRVGALAERHVGAGRNSSHFLFVPIGTGIAGAVMFGGEPYRGARGWSGEIGHLVVRPGGAPCACGGRGCLEAYASATAIGARYAPGAAAEDVIAKAALGDRGAMAVWHEALDTLADALAACTTIVDPELIVLGGGLSQAGNDLRKAVRQRLAARLAFRPAPSVALAVLGAKSAMLGAAILAWRAAGIADAGHDWGNRDPGA